MSTACTSYRYLLGGRSNQCLLGFDFTHAAKPAADHFQPAKRHYCTKKTFQLQKDIISNFLPTRDRTAGLIPGFW